MATCDLRLDERCYVLIYNGQPGYLMHPRGIPRKQSKCPLRYWGEGTTVEQRLETCRKCEHYRNKESDDDST